MDYKSIALAQEVLRNPPKFSLKYVLRLLPFVPYDIRLQLQNAFPDVGTVQFDTVSSSSPSGVFLKRYYSKYYKSYIIKTSTGSFNERLGRFFPKGYTKT